MSRTGATREPKYKKVWADLLEDILNGTYPVGSMLPNEMDLVDQLGVSRNTIRTAMQLLERQGLIMRRKHAGTQVVANQLEPTFRIDFQSIDALKALLEQTTLDVRERTQAPLPDHLAKLAFPDRDADGGAGRDWYKVAGLRLTEGTRAPVSWSTYYIDPAYPRAADQVGRTRRLIYTVIQDLYQVPIERVDITLEGGTSEPWLAAALGCEPGEPLVHLIERAVTEDGETVEVVEALYPSRVFTFNFSIRVR